MSEETWLQKIFGAVGRFLCKLVMHEYGVSKREMCESAKSVCNRNCESCAWHEED